MGTRGGCVSRRSLVMRELLVLFWLANMALAMSSGLSHSLDVDAPVDAEANNAGGGLVAPMGSTAEMVQLGASAKGDGCSGAYKKFKANIDKMQAIKNKATKQAAAAKKGKKKADTLYKRCKKDHKEILSKASWKKA